MIEKITCFKCWNHTATLTYEENRIYKVSCSCGCSYEFEHSSMKAAHEYHNKMLELYGEIDRNAKLKTELTLITAERDQWKAKAEALERALLINREQCESCTKINTCNRRRDNCGYLHDWKLWQFDEAKFSDKKEDAANE